MGIYSTKPRWQHGLRPVVLFCARKQVHPDVFTAGALLLSSIAAVAFWLAGANRIWLWLVPPCLLLRLVLNLMDGLVAREMGLADTWGEAKNEFGDRVADVLVFLGLLFGGYADPRLVGLVLALVLSSSYLGILGKALGGPRVYAGLIGKGDRMISLAVFSFYPLFSANLKSYDLYLALAAGAAGITIFQRLRSIYGNAQSA